MKKSFSFTMAEILISLTIIGVIAAITLPSLKANINEKTWAIQRKALYSRLSQAISMMPSLNGYGEYSGSWCDNSVSVEKDTAAQAFITDGLAKVFEINNICSVEHGATDAEILQAINKCGIPTKYTCLGGTKATFPIRLSNLNRYFNEYEEGFANNNNEQKKVNTRVAALETKNGESIAVFYNPYCTPKDVISLASWSLDDNYREFTFPHMCLNFIYDLNGNKGPNKINKDMGVISVFYPTDSEVVSFMFAEKPASSSSNVTQPQAIRLCKNQKDDYVLPNIEELFILLLNREFLGLADTCYWSSNVVDVNNAKCVCPRSGLAYWSKNSARRTAHCGKRLNR